VRARRRPSRGARRFRVSRARRPRGAERGLGGQPGGWAKKVETRTLQLERVLPQRLVEVEIGKWGKEAPDGGNQFRKEEGAEKPMVQGSFLSLVVTGQQNGIGLWE
jgi:hypothetical protein